MTLLAQQHIGVVGQQTGDLRARTIEESLLLHTRPVLRLLPAILAGVVLAPGTGLAAPTLVAQSLPSAQSVPSSLSAPRPLSLTSYSALAGLRRGVSLNLYPGGTFVAGHGSSVRLQGAVGHVLWSSDSAVPSPDRTIYDVASISKSVTATAVMLLVDDGRLRLDDRVGVYLPTYRSGLKAHVTYRMLLGHRAGERDYVTAATLHGSTPETLRDRVERLPLIASSLPASYHYSNVGYVILWDAAQKAAGMPLQTYLQRRLFTPLGMASTGYRPDVHRTATNSMEDVYDHIGAVLPAGTVQDTLARRLRGYAGNAGLFTTARDLSHYAMMLAAGGRYGTRQVLKASTLRTFRTARPGTAYGLGFRTNASGLVGSAWSSASFGHTGWTGGGIFVDPATHNWSVWLTNRMYRPRYADREYQRTLIYKALRVTNGYVGALR